MTRITYHIRKKKDRLRDKEEREKNSEEIRGSRSSKGRIGGGVISLFRWSKGIIHRPLFHVASVKCEVA